MRETPLYAQVVKYYGTHYVAAGTLGGRANMRTVISHDYYSTQSDSSISAQIHVTWNLFGGGGGGGSSSNKTDQRWTQNSESSTHTEGGDPSIKSFNSAEEWKAWALSVETTSPVVTSVALEPLWSLVADTQKRSNMMKAIAVYASNESFPIAALEGYRMDWCDCEVQHSNGPPGPPRPFPGGPTGITGKCDGEPSLGVAQANCPEGKVMTAIAMDDCGGTGTLRDKERGPAISCCRPCFTAKN